MAENDGKAVTVWLPGDLARAIEDAAAAQVPSVTRSAFLGFVLQQVLRGDPRGVYETLVERERNKRIVYEDGVA